MVSQSNYYEHPMAEVETEKVGEGTRIWAFAHVLDGVDIGRNCNICDHTFVEQDVKIGDEVTLKSGVYLWDGVRLRDKVFVGPNATFVNDMQPRSRKSPEEFEITEVEKGASIGANATILGGLTVYPWAMIGAGSVVTTDVPSHTLVYGNPATIQGYVCKCGEQLRFGDSNTVGCDCGERYNLVDGEITRS